jgi:hypothetical protein
MPGASLRDATVKTTGMIGRLGWEKPNLPMIEPI